MQGKTERKKIHVQRVAQKKVLAHGKSIPAREMLAKNVQLENTTPPPHNFSNGLSPK